ncbi:Maf family protein [Bradyrhizobium sp. LM2.3]
MLLANAGLQFEAIAADIDERGTQAASKIFQTARDWPLLARQKAKAVSAHPSGGYVIRADQTLVTVWAPKSGSEVAFTRKRGAPSKKPQLRS